MKNRGEKRVPFFYKSADCKLCEESPKTLQRYALLILPNVECMSLRQIEEVLGFIEKGGSVLIGQDTGTFDLWRRRRVENPWNVLFGGVVVADIRGDAVAEAGLCQIFSVN